eukprot:s148_g20.t1
MSPKRGAMEWQRWKEMQLLPETSEKALKEERVNQGGAGGDRREGEEETVGKTTRARRAASPERGIHHLSVPQAEGGKAHYLYLTIRTRAL